MAIARATATRNLQKSLSFLAYSFCFLSYLLLPSLAPALVGEMGSK
eukprot:COSAG05_NODE_308_length_11651_cov_65.387985_1_plen_46_part_00